jgi:hypothetical protein
MNKGLIGLGAGSSLRTTSPSPPDKNELGLVIDHGDPTAAFGSASGSGNFKMKDEGEEDEDGDAQVIWPVPVDTSLRIGDPTNIEGLFSTHPSSDTARMRLLTNADNFFGLAPPRTTLTHLRARHQTLDQGQGQKYTPHAPFRFAVEFWGLDTLKEKVRLHSHTVWYAGSLWNVYTQAVRKKGGTGVQVGVYLHRQSSVDPLPSVSAPRPAPALQAAPPSTFVAPIPVPLSSVVMQGAPSASGPSTSAGRGRAQSEGGSRLSGSRSAIWRATTPRLSSPSTVSVLATHPTSPIRSPSSISVVAAANPSGPVSGKYSHAHLPLPITTITNTWAWERRADGVCVFLRSDDVTRCSAPTAVPRPACANLGVFHDRLPFRDWEQSDTVLERARHGE